MLAVPKVEIELWGIVQPAACHDVLCTVRVDQAPVCLYFTPFSALKMLDHGAD
jgi:hypothetical protein